jgi:hypothetical protein
MTRYMLGWVIGYHSERHGEFLQEVDGPAYDENGRPKDAIIFKSKEKALAAANKLDKSPVEDARRFIRGYCYWCDIPKHAQQMKVLGLLKDFDTSPVYIDP